MIVDVHTHLSTLEQWGPYFLEAFGRTYQGSGIDLHTPPERHWTAGVHHADKAIVFGINSLALQMHTPNDQIAAYQRAHPEKIIGFMSIDPNQPDALDEIDRCVSDLGLRGIKMSPVYQHYDPAGPRAERVHARAEELGLPILTHAAFHGITNTPMEWANPLLYDPVCRRFPKLTLILAHIGLPWYTDAMVMIRKHPHVYADISGALFRPWWMYQAMALVHESGLTHKLLFGTDFPLTTFDQTVHALRHVNDVVAGTALPRIPAEDIEGIIHRDALALLGLT
ncbi:MAG: amidohydrolase [Actinobacteria bacterium]|nr:amidohydrolase [Actinomycetota bacterium]